MTKVLGVIGGVGPLSTAYFQELIVKMTNAKIDQEHLNMIIFNMPMIPDRTKYILDKSNDNPVPVLINIAKELEKLNVSYLAMPCITAHHFYDDIIKETNVEFINVIKETRKLLIDKNVHSVGIMATEGTINSQLFQKEMGKAGIDVKVPSKRMQCYVTELIYDNVKSDIPADTKKYDLVIEDLREQGAEVIIIGCTELSLINKEHKVEYKILDTLELLAKRSIELNDLQVKEEYNTLF
ncbi:cysteate racemase [Vallitalea maricola]